MCHGVYGIANITQTLQTWSSRSTEERGEVIAQLYSDLRAVAAKRLSGEHLVELQPTLLVNEAYFRLIKISRMDMTGRQHFYALAGKVMREVLLDFAKAQNANKRRHDALTLATEAIIGPDFPILDILKWEELLVELEQIDPLYVSIFEARAFAGMTLEETADMFDLSVSTIRRKWQAIVAWIKVALE